MMVKNRRANKNVSLLLFFIFLNFALFLVKRHKTFFGFGFKSFFFGLVILLFWFWVLVKCKKWFFIFCIWFWFFIYFILYWLIAWHPPFYLAPLFFILASPFFIWSVKTNYIFICHPFATATAPAPLSLDPR
jgi:hypothetical protein